MEHSSLHVVLYHDAVIPPPRYGGTERVVAWLAQGLVELGVRVSLIARPGSQVKGAHVIPLEARHGGGNWVSLIPKDASIVHLRGTSTEKIPVPFIMTIDGNGQPGERFHPNTIFLSKRHAENHGSRTYVFNGIDVRAYPCEVDPSQREDRLVFLAKASWSVKNLKGAITVARRAGMVLDVLGSRSYPLEIQRFLPRISGVKFHGMVDDAYKVQILKRARALIFPVRWDEPFGLAVTEALASGCSVVGTPYGSLPEIVSPEVGFLSANSEECVAWLRACKTSGSWPLPQSCRARVNQGFTHVQMAEGYLKHYASILNTGSIGAGANGSQTRPGFVARDLLPWA